jgi:hypothetical protein
MILGTILGMFPNPFLKLKIQKILMDPSVNNLTELTKIITRMKSWSGVNRSLRKPSNFLVKDGK